jgi:MFS family permease
MNRWNRIIPAAFLMYTIAYADRTNFALAISALQREFHITSGQAALASGIFFAGYFLSQMPGGYLAQVWSAKRFIFWSLLVWGAAATLCGFAHSMRDLLILRFCLGLGEGGVWPATIVLLASWFEPHERARASGYWVLCQPAAIVASSPLSGWLLDHYNWRVMFIVEGLFPVLFAAMWWWAVEDRPSAARWARERDPEPFQAAPKTSRSARRSRFSFLWSRDVILFLILSLSFSCGAYGLLIWLPSAIRSLGTGNNLLIGIFTALPYLFAGVGAVWNSRRSDRTRERKWHTGLASITAGIALILGFLCSAKSPGLGLLLLCITGAGIYASIGPKWALMTELLPKESAGVALGLINGFGNFGGFAGPYIVGILRDSTGSFSAGFVFLSAALVLAGVLVPFLGISSGDKTEAVVETVRTAASGQAAQSLDSSRS